MQVLHSWSPSYISVWYILQLTALNSQLTLKNGVWMLMWFKAGVVKMSSLILGSEPKVLDNVMSPKPKQWSVSGSLSNARLSLRSINRILVMPCDLLSCAVHGNVRSELSGLVIVVFIGYFDGNPCHYASSSPSFRFSFFHWECVTNFSDRPECLLCVNVPLGRAG